MGHRGPVSYGLGASGPWGLEPSRNQSVNQSIIPPKLWLQLTKLHRVASQKTVTLKRFSRLLQILLVNNFLRIGMKTSRSAWIRIVIPICMSAQLFLLNKVIYTLHVSTNKVIFRPILYTLNHTMLCTHWEPSVFTPVKYLSHIICKLLFISRNIWPAY